MQERFEYENDKRRPRKSITSVSTKDFLECLEEENIKNRRIIAGASGLSHEHESQPRGTTRINSPKLLNELNAVAKSALGTSAERILGRAHAFALLTFPVRGGQHLTFTHFQFHLIT